MKRGEINFVTLFAIIAGIFILVSIIYGATKISDTKAYESNTKIAKQISVFLDPLQVGFATSSKGLIDFNQNVKMKNICDNYTNAGMNKLSISTLNSKKQFSDFSVPISIYDKYIFSHEEIEDSLIYTISRKFSYPYEVSDFIILIPSNTKYCFEDAPDKIIDSLSAFNLDNMLFSNCKDDKDFIQICAGSSRCDVEVIGLCNDFSCSSKYDFGYIRKNRDYFYYVDDLIYPAIFSDIENYNCNLERLIYKTSLVAELYSLKSYEMYKRGCVSNIDIDSWMDKTKKMKEITDIIGYYEDSLNLKSQNKIAGCNLW